MTQLNPVKLKTITIPLKAYMINVSCYVLNCIVTALFKIDTRLSDKSQLNTVAFLAAIILCSEHPFNKHVTENQKKTNNKANSSYRNVRTGAIYSSDKTK